MPETTYAGRGFLSRMLAKAAELKYRTSALVNTPHSRAPDDEHASLVQELRDSVARLPELEASDRPGAGSQWTRNRSELRKLILHRDPRKFLTWRLIRKTMFAGNEPYVFAELEALQNSDDWTRRWKEAIREDSLGMPQPFIAYPESSGNLIHHAYHIRQFEQVAGRIAAFASVVEIGGGYGSMCRLLRRLDFKGPYSIVDFPDFALLQRYFLSGIALEREGVQEGTTDFVGSLDNFNEHVRIQPRLRLMIATWSLSEMEEDVRSTLGTSLNAFDGYLIAYQESFRGIDNRVWFREWSESLPDIEWTFIPIPHLPGNWYLFGVSRDLERGGPGR